jgi:sulfur carrier protein
MERVTGIEPAYFAWEANVLPLNYTRIEEAGSRKTSKVCNTENPCRAAIIPGLGQELPGAFTAPSILLELIACTQLIQLTINGNTRTFEETQFTVAQLVGRMGLEGKRIAIERNGEIVPRTSYAETSLASGDRLEIVGAVGGG